MSATKTVNLQNVSVYDMLQLMEKSGILQQYFTQKKELHDGFSWDLPFSLDQIHELKKTEEHSSLQETLYKKFSVGK